MQPTYTEIKIAGRKSLKSRWPEAVAVSIIILTTKLLDKIIQSLLMTLFKVDAVWNIFAPTKLPLYSVFASIGITLFSAFFSLLVVTPLLMGILRWFWETTGHGNTSIGDIFYYFSSGKSFFKAFGVSIGLFFRLAISVIVCFFPYTLFSVLTSPGVYDSLNMKMPVMMSAMFPLTTAFEIIGFFVFMLWISGYLFVLPVLFEQENLTVRQIFKEYKAIASGQRMHTLGFIVSFIGWFLLCILIVPIIFVIPYFFSSMAVYAREISRYYSHRCDTNQNFFNDSTFI